MSGPVFHQHFIECEPARLHRKIPILQTEALGPKALSETLLSQLALTGAVYFQNI